jgi:hypothetical protein
MIPSGDSAAEEEIRTHGCPTHHGEYSSRRRNAGSALAQRPVRPQIRHHRHTTGPFSVQSESPADRQGVCVTVALTFSQGDDAGKTVAMEV